MNNKVLLKPCPFCGGKAELAYGSHDYNVWTVLCCNENCNASAGWADTPEEAAEAWNRRIEPKPQWIPVTERMPQEHQIVVGWTKDNPFSCYREEVVTWNGKGWVFVYAQRYVTNVTYWLPLPKPYKPEGLEGSK